MKGVIKFTRIGGIISIMLLCAQVSQATVFQVNGVESWDTLNMRAAPGSKNTVVTKIPFNGKGIQATGRKESVGSTVWVHVNWQGKSGWVSERYIRTTQETTNQAVIPNGSAITATPQKPVAAKTKPITRTKAVAGSKGKWVLECGDRSPFWSAVVHPKALDINLRGKPAGMIPITYEKQDRNRWNTAMKTKLKSTNGRFSADLTIKYTKQCLHTLSNQKVHYRVDALINGEAFKGCCRAVRLQ